MRLQSIWVLVADGARARILRDVFSVGELPGEHDDLIFQAQRRRLREIMTDLVRKCRAGCILIQVDCSLLATAYGGVPAGNDDVP